MLKIVKLLFKRSVVTTNLKQSSKFTLTLIFFLILFSSPVASQNLISPQDFFGFKVGADYHLINYQEAAVEVSYDSGRIILLGFRVQHRGQSLGTFKLLFNSLFYGAVKE